jgi:heavy metal translocating P-type ATPase
MKQLEGLFDLILLIFLAGFLILHYLFQLGPNDGVILLISASLGAIPVIFNAIFYLKNKKVSIDLLAGIALTAALLSGEWSSAVFINLMLVSARIFSRYTDDQARQAIKSLLKLRPQRVKIRKGNHIVEIDVAHVTVGDLIIIEAGERIPIDGIVEVGTASIDQASLTGESIPIEKKKGDKVLSSTLCITGSLEVKALKVGKDTTLAKIINLVESSQKAKAGIHTTAEKFTTRYIVVTLIGAGTLYFFTYNINLVLALLLVSCADDLALAVPLAFLAAIGSAARQGIIIKGGDFLERLTHLKILLLDKTGTLTRGTLSVHSIVTFEKYSQEEILKYASAVEFFSEHPAAKAIIKHAMEQHLRFPKLENFHETPGKGCIGLWNGKEIISGKLDYLKEKRVNITESQIKEIESAVQKGLNTTLVSYAGSLIGFIGLADQIRPEVPSSIQKLKDLGVKRLVMITGDNERVVKNVARDVNISEFYANLLPEDKLKFIRKQLNKKEIVGMVGDGVNDAAALALADVSIAMGAIGSDAAIEVADIALMKDDFSEIPAAIKLGKFTLDIVYQDFVIWGLVNVVGFWLVFNHFIGPQGAAAYNFGTDFLPFLNSLRLFRLHKNFYSLE